MPAVADTYCCARCGWESSPEDDAALAILEALGEEFAGEAIPYVWTHPDGFWGMSILSVGLLDEDNRWTFTRVTRMVATDCAFPIADLVRQDLRRCFDAREWMDTLCQP